MTNFRKIISCIAVAAFAFAASASATTVLVTDEFGSNILDGTMLVQPLSGNSLSNVIPDAVQARALRSGGYVVAGVVGPAHIEFTHPAYGTLESKAIFGNDTIELVLGSEGRGYALKHSGMEFDKSVSDANRMPCANAVPLDFADMTDGNGLTVTGTTSTNNNTTSCGANGGDWVGSFTATNSQNLNFTTCLAANGAPLNLDTIINVRNGSCGVLSPAQCDDDSCPGAPGFTFNSILNNVPVVNGSSYTVIIDRWASTTPMTFDLFITEPFELDPPAGGCIDENEPNCGGTLPPSCTPNDTVNGGCNFTPALYSEVACGDTYCSTYGNCNGALRDTDWYRVQETSIRIAEWCCIGEASPSLFGSVASGHSFGSECPATAFASYVTPADGVEACVTQLQFPGSWLYFGATLGFSGAPCGLEYQCTLTCECPAPCDGGGGGTSAAAGGLQAGDAARARY